MNQVANYSSLDSKALELRIINKKGEMHEVSFKWNCTGFKGNMMYIQLVFAEPEIITMDVSCLVFEFFSFKTSWN